MSANINILLIEDDQDDIELLQEALRENGVNARFEVLMQGNRIVSWLEQPSMMPDVVIMDLNLPKMHGREVLQLIKEQQRFQHVPVMVLTTSSQEEEKRYCLEHGASYFKSKPATNEGFVDLVKTILKMASKPVC